jgi:hypothetical protein
VGEVQQFLVGLQWPREPFIADDSPVSEVNIPLGVGRDYPAHA